MNYNNRVTHEETGVVEVLDVEAYTYDKREWSDENGRWEDPTDVATCGTCGRSWDDAIVTSITPAPSAQCPFEYDHEGEEADEVQHQACEYEHDGLDTDGTEWFNCTTHDELAPSSDAPCNGYHAGYDPLVTVPVGHLRAILDALDALDGVARSDIQDLDVARRVLRTEATKVGQ